MNLVDEVRGLEKLNPLWSTYLCLATVVKGKELDIEEISKAFKIVPKDEYTTADREKIINHLYKLSHNRV